MLDQKCDHRNNEHKCRWSPLFIFASVPISFFDPMSNRATKTTHTPPFFFCFSLGQLFSCDDDEQA